MKIKQVLLTALGIAGFAVTSLAQTVPAYVPTNGLVGWWPFNGNANDESGNGHNGTANNGAILTTDRFNITNNAYYLDGVNDYISSTLGSLTKMSFSFWYNSDNPINFYPMFLYIDGIQFCVMAGNNPAYIQNNNVGHLGGYSDLTNYISSLPCIPGLSAWHHVVIVYDNTLNLYAIYINGNSCGSSGTAINPLAITAGNATFGNTTSGTIADGNAGVLGKLDDIGIWNRALTQQEITDLYNACSVTSIVSQPTNQTLASGSNAVFNVSATAGSILQWQTNLGLGFQNLSNAGQYSGVTTQTLTVSSIGVNNNNQTFRCIVGSGSCSDTSNVATLSLSSVGVEDLSLLKNVELYPNPATAELLIKSVLKFSSIKIINNVGQVVLNKDAANTIDVSSLSKGIYFIKLYDDKGQFLSVKKFMKE